MRIFPALAIARESRSGPRNVTTKELLNSSERSIAHIDTGSSNITGGDAFVIVASGVRTSRTTSYTERFAGMFPISTEAAVNASSFDNGCESYNMLCVSGVLSTTDTPRD